MSSAPQLPVLDDLSEAERFLVQSTVRGEPADLRRHAVRAGVIRDLLLEARPGWILPAAGLRVHKAIIEGGLDLEGCTLSKPFLLWHSRIQGGGERGAILVRDAKLKRLGITDLVLAGFMTHVCVNSTARAAFNHGYRPTVVADATATRALANPTGGTLSARELHDGALTALSDIFAIVVPSGEKVPT